jgi:polysaccharide biosynthesis protein PslG
MAKSMLHMTRKTAALALSLALLTSLAFAASAQALPSKFWGAVPQSTLSAEQFQRISRGGVETIRVPLGWGDLQPNEGGAINWSGVDAIVERAALAGIDVLPTVTGAPTWAVPTARVPGGGGAKAPAHLPVSGSAAGGWKSLLAQAAERYGPGGQFWATHLNVPAKPIRYWQIWNEPNFKFFLAKPNPADYGKLVKLSAAALKSVDPGAKVVLAGLFSQPLGGRYVRVVNGKKKIVNRSNVNYFASYFLDQMYKKTPGIKSKFVGYSLHPYTGSWKQLTPSIEEVRRVMAANRDGAKGLWITELGWSSGPPRSDGSNSFAKGPAGQARELRLSFRLLKSKQKRWKIQRLYWFSVDDAKGVCNFCDGSGLFGEGFTPKKSWFEYVKFAGGKP